MFRGDSYACRSHDPSVYDARVIALQLCFANTEDADDLEPLRDEVKRTINCQKDVKNVQREMTTYSTRDY